MEQQTINLVIPLTTFILILFILLYKKYYCKHDYVFIKEVNLYLSEKNKMPYGSERIYECSKCRKIKKNVI